MGEEEYLLLLQNCRRSMGCYEPMATQEVQALRQTVAGEWQAMGLQIPRAPQPFFRTLQMQNAPAPLTAKQIAQGLQGMRQRRAAGQ